VEEEILFFTTFILVLWTSEVYILIIQDLALLALLYNNYAKTNLRISWNGYAMLSIGVLGLLFGRIYVYCGMDVDTRAYFTAGP
jgi:hypothetical protein